MQISILVFFIVYIAVILSINEIDLCYLLSHSSIALAITSKLVVGSKRATT